MANKIKPTDIKKKIRSVMLSDQDVVRLKHLAQDSNLSKAIRICMDKLENLFKTRYN